MSPAVMGFLAVLALVALLYFSLVVSRAQELASVLMRRGYEARGWTLARLAARLRLLGVVGVVVALAAIAVAVMKIVA